jgi:hypothetical protein
VPRRVPTSELLLTVVTVDLKCAAVGIAQHLGFAVHGRYRARRRGRSSSSNNGVSLTPSASAMCHSDRRISLAITKNAGDRRVYWQGPSLGFDFGGDGARTMMLVYDLPATDAIYQRFVGIEGSAYFVGGLGMTALSFNNIVIVPVRSGVGLRLGANVGYLKFTPTSTWNPF